jgi:hypothetical protein
VVTSLISGLLTAKLDSVTVQSLGQAASCIGDFELADTMHNAAVARLRAEGRLQVLTRALLLQAWAQLRRGQWSSAMPLAEEGRRIAEETGQLEWQANGQAAEAMAAALRGDAAPAAAFATRAEQIAVPHHMTNAAATTLLARATSAAGEGDYPLALEYLERMHRDGDPAHHPVQALWSLSQLAHAAIQCGQAESVRTLVRQLTQRFPVTSAGPAAQMNVLRAEALLAPEEQVCSDPGCGGSSAPASPGSTCERHETGSTAWARHPGPTAPATNCGRPACPAAHPPRTPGA